MRRISSLAIGIFLMVNFVLTAFAANAVPEAVLRSAQSVVRILTEYTDGYGTGSGFVIKSDDTATWIVTNYHVVEGDPYDISVWIGENEALSAKVLASSEQRDLCVLELSLPVSMMPLQIAGQSSRQGDPVYAVGFPAAADILSDREAHSSEAATITDGIVSAVREVTLQQYGVPVKLLQISAAINAGNSGGPLFNENGEVVGINTYGIADAQGIFGAVDSVELRMFLELNGLQLEYNNDMNAGVIVLVCLVVAAVVAVAAFVLLYRKKSAVASSEKQKMPRIRSAKVRFVVIVAPAAVILISVYLAGYLGANHFAKVGDMDKARTFLFAPQITRLHDPRLPAYMEAWDLMDNRSYDAARERFSQLTGYLDADEMVLEADYRHAQHLESTNDYAGAIRIFSVLKKTGYKDSDEKLLSTQYRQILYVMQKDGDYLAAYKQLSQRKFNSIQGINETRSELMNTVYEIGRNLYANGEYTAAEEHFFALGDYLDSANYAALADIHNTDHVYNADKAVQTLLNCLSFEDAAELLLSKQELAEAFLKGVWESDSGGMRFAMKADGSISYTLPDTDYGEYYKFENGEMLMYYEDHEAAARTEFSFRVMNSDCIEVYCYKDGSVYTLFRQ